MYICFTVKKGRTALHWAAEYGHLSVAKALVAAGANIQVKDQVSAVDALVSDRMTQ
jgi:ankyrin repeat protein